MRASSHWGSYEKGTSATRRQGNFNWYRTGGNLVGRNPRSSLLDQTRVKKKRASGHPVKTAAERKARRAAAVRRYKLTPRGKFSQHKQNAKRRGIPFELTFTQWCEIWDASGRWKKRGNFKGAQYVMSRHGDVGPYAVGNVIITRHRDNIATQNRQVFSRYGRVIDAVPGAEDPVNYPEVPF